MSRRITALLLALAMSGVLFATALAEEDTAEQSAQTAQAEAQSETTADNAATKSTAEGAQGETDTAAALVQETTQENEADANVPDLSPVADLTFAQVEERVRNNNLTILALWKLRTIKSFSGIWMTSWMNWKMQRTGLKR